MSSGSEPELRRARSLAAVNLLVLAALAIGLVNNVVVAAVFGLTRRVDAFFAAMTLPTLVMILCVDYLGKNFLPVLALAKQEGEEVVSTITSSIVTIVAIFATAAAALLVIFAGPVFDHLLPGFNDSDTVLVRRYFLIMAPSIVLMAVNTFHEYVCQYDEKFVLVTAIRIALPGANLAAIALLAPAIGEYCLPVGFLLGHLVSFVLLARHARYKFRPRIVVRPHLERRVFANSAIVMSTGFIARTKSILMNYLASTLPGGVISALALATKLTEPLERSTFAGVRMFLFSRTARLFAERNHRALAGLYRTGLCVSFLVLTPVLWWICLNSPEIVKTVFARGQFTPEMAALVAAALVALTPSVLLIGVNQMLSNAFYAMNRVKVPALVMPAGTFVYAAAAVPFASWLGAQGLALATTVTTAMVFVGMYICISRALRDLRPVATALQLLSYAVLAGAAMGGVQAILRAFGLPGVVVAIASLPLGAALYCVALAAFRDRTFQRLRGYARGMIAFGDAGGAAFRQRLP